MRRSREPVRRSEPAIVGLRQHAAHVAVFAQKRSRWPLSVSGMVVEMVSDDFSVDVIDCGVLARTNHFLTSEATPWITAGPSEGSSLRLARIQDLLGQVENSPTLRRP